MVQLSVDMFAYNFISVGKAVWFVTITKSNVTLTVIPGKYRLLQKLGVKWRFSVLLRNSCDIAVWWSLCKVAPFQRFCKPSTNIGHSLVPYFPTQILLSPPRYIPNRRGIGLIPAPHLQLSEPCTTPPESAKPNGGIGENNGQFKSNGVRKKRIAERKRRRAATNTRYSRPSKIARRNIAESKNPFSTSMAIRPTSPVH